jgi:hypothetical protein
MTDRTAREIAEGLTVPMRDALLNGCGCDIGEAMEEAGLWRRVFPENPYDYLPTTLGLSARQILEQETPPHD